MGTTDTPRPPSALLLAAEWPRAAWGVFELARDWRSLPRTPHGNGRPVLVLPGLFNSDRSNFVLRRYLDQLGYRSFGWGFGRNLGGRTIGAQAERLIERVEAIRQETGEPVALVGVSLGGIMARLVAHRRPELVQQVVTISSPFAGSPRATNVWRQFQWLTGEGINDPAVAARLAEAARPLPMPATALWSRSDGLVCGAICREAGETGQNIEVRSSHLLVQLRPIVLRTVAEVLRGSSP